MLQHTSGNDAEPHRDAVRGQVGAHRRLLLTCGDQLGQDLLDERRLGRQRRCHLGVVRHGAEDGDEAGQVFVGGFVEDVVSPQVESGGLLVAVVFGVERLGPHSLMIRRPTGRDLECVLYAFGIVMAWSWVAGRLAPQRDNDGIATIVGLGVAGVIILIGTAAVTEEVVYRGFLAERLGAMFGRRPWARPLGATLSLVIFVLPHLTFFGPSWLLHQLPGTLAIAGIALFRRNLVAAMLLHLLINLPILIPTLLRDAS
jgi:membrane protease YdiL (CAAX protease family)